MLRNCDQCRKDNVDIKLRKGTDEAYCTECGQQIENITKFAINAMHFRKDYIEEKRQSFSFPCKSCGDRRNGLVTLDGKQVVCADCDNEINVSPFMRLTMKNLGLYIAKTATTTTEEVEEE